VLRSTGILTFKPTSANKSWHILEFEQRHVAQHLTLNASRLFFAISYEEFLEIGSLLVLSLLALLVRKYKY
jgi:hypothetical protein